MKNEYFIEINFAQKIKKGELVPGDCFLSKKFDGERIISVLADGLGSGVKANVLSTMTAAMAIKFAYNYREIEKLAETIMKVLPICSVRKISYSTFTIVDIIKGSNIRVIEYDNPEYLILRNNDFFKIPKREIEFTNPNIGKRKIKYSEFEIKLNDRIIFFSDGVVQSGMGTIATSFGWGMSKVKEYILDILRKNPEISSYDLCDKVVSQALENDFYCAKDDITCASIFYRKPRKLLIITGPPYDQSKDKYIAHMLESYKGKKIICGGTTSNIIARELNREITVDMQNISPEIPPVSYMEGVEIITEGIVTLEKIYQRLKKEKLGFLKKNSDKKKPFDLIISLLLDSDLIEFIVGTKINEFHQNPDLPVELSIRRNIVKKIKNILENKFLKKVTIKYV